MAVGWRWSWPSRRTVATGTRAKPGTARTGHQPRPGAPGQGRGAGQGTGAGRGLASSSDRAHRVKAVALVKALALVVGWPAAQTGRTGSRPWRRSWPSRRTVATGTRAKPGTARTGQQLRQSGKRTPYTVHHLQTPCTSAFTGCELPLRPASAEVPLTGGAGVMATGTRAKPGTARAGQQLRLGAQSQGRGAGAGRRRALVVALAHRPHLVKVKAVAIKAHCRQQHRHQSNARHCTGWPPAQTGRTGSRSWAGQQLRPGTGSRPWPWSWAGAPGRTWSWS